MAEVHMGGCACGAIRYAVKGNPIFQNHCHCRDCQRMSGTGHGSYLTFPRDGLELHGAAAHWDMVADNGTVKTRGFCPTCGSPVYMTFAANPGVFTVHAASLDDPKRYAPQAVTFNVGRYEWDDIDPALRKFEKMPT
jgi:hypothetical protein